MKLPEYDDEYLLFGMLFVIGNRLQVIGDSFYEEITTKQWFVLVMLEIFGETYPTLNELSDSMGSSHQNVKQLVLKLEGKGYVTMYTDSEDRRKTRIRKTDKCQELIEKYGGKEKAFMQSLFAGIDKVAIKKTLETVVQLEKNMMSLGPRQKG